MNHHLPENPNDHISFHHMELKDIYVAGGCFWGVEAYMARVLGVAETSVGYANGHTDNPTYKAVCSGTTGYVEAVHLRYAPSMISLAALLAELIGVIDPTSVNKQGGDVGSQYRTGIYFVDSADKETITTFLNQQQQHYKKPIVTEVLPLTNYTLAEEYHQQYLEKNPGGYCHISFNR